MSITMQKIIIVKFIEINKFFNVLSKLFSIIKPTICTYYVLVPNDILIILFKFSTTKN